MPIIQFAIALWLTIWRTPPLGYIVVAIWTIPIADSLIGNEKISKYIDSQILIYKRVKIQEKQHAMYYEKSFDGIKREVL